MNNNIRLERTLLDDPDVGNEIVDELNVAQIKLGKALTAAARVEGRLGGTKKPDILDIQRMQLKEIMTLNDTMRGFSNAYRQVVGFTLFRSRFNPLVLSCSGEGTRSY